MPTTQRKAEAQHPEGPAAHRVIGLQGSVHYAFNFQLSNDVQLISPGIMTAVNVYASDPAQNFEEYERFMHMFKQVLSEGRKEGARVFVDRWRPECRIVLMGDVDDLEEISGPQSWS